MLGMSPRSVGSPFAMVVKIATISSGVTAFQGWYALRVVV